MSKENYRTEVLELLASGKINIDEAVRLLDQSHSDATDSVKTESLDEGDTPLKVDVDVDLDVDIEKEVSKEYDFDVENEDYHQVAKKSAAREPRWLRILVEDLETGKSKVKVNIPFGMVKFGLGVAQFFAPQEYSENLGQIEEMMAEADSGLLVDVQDVEDNEHVRIYFD